MTGGEKMAKKDDSKLEYLQMPLPSGRKYYKMTKRAWSGLNLKQTVDTGMMTTALDVSTAEYPHLVPAQSLYMASGRQKSGQWGYANPIGLFGFDDFIIVIYRDGGSIKLDYLPLDENGEIPKDSDNYMTKVYTGVLKAKGAGKADEYPRCVVQFNRYDAPTDPTQGGYTKRLLIFPDKLAMNFDIDNDNITIDKLSVDIREYCNDTEPYFPPETANHSYYYKNTSEAAKAADTLYGAAVYRYVEDDEDSDNSGWKICVPPAFPDIEYATVHLSRLFGVSKDRVYASGFNDYSNWNMDTVNEYNESNAWCSTAQSNTKADGDFKGITNYQGHIVCFKHDFMHEIYSTKNPFRIHDIYAEGAVSNSSIQEVDGKLIFVSDDAVKIYTGSNPRIISDVLNVKRFENVTSGSDGRNYYISFSDENASNHLYVYDTYNGYWSELDAIVPMVGFANNKKGMYALDNAGSIWRLDSGKYTSHWVSETDLITNETVDIKHIRKIQMLALIPEGSELDVYILYDNEVFDENKSHHVYTSAGKGYGLKPIRVKPRQTANYGIKLHIEGRYYVKVYELELCIEQGGDLYV